MSLLFLFRQSSNIYYCTENRTCYLTYDKIIYEKNECVNKCENDDIYKYEFKKRCYKQCLHIILNKNLKIYPIDKSCVGNCTETDYKYEYNNTCYNECPNGTYS